MHALEPKRHRGNNECAMKAVQVGREATDHNGYCAFILSAIAITEVLDDLTVARLTSVSSDMHIEKISKPQA